MVFHTGQQLLLSLVLFLPDKISVFVTKKKKDDKSNMLFSLTKKMFSSVSVNPKNFFLLLFGQLVRLLFMKRLHRFGKCFLWKKA